MGATPSTSTTAASPTDDRPFLERMLDPSGVFSATSTHPALLRHLNPNPNDSSPPPRTTIPTHAPSPSSSTACDSHVSLSIDHCHTTTPNHSDRYSHLDTVELQDDRPPTPHDDPLDPDPDQNASNESYVDSALSLIAPPNVVALLASPAVSGEMQFVDEARRRHGDRAAASTSTSRMTV